MGSELNLGTTELLALAAALGWASGMRLYAVVFLTGLAGYLGWVPLPDGLKLLEQPALLWASGIMLAVEFLADKIPVVDSMWDAVHTFIRVPAGAALAAGVFGFDGSQMALVAGLMGGTLAATSHAAKASTRAAVNTSPEPFSNIGLSLLGDAAVPTLLSDEAVVESDAVVTMGCGDACPIFPGKRYENWELPDPAGQGLDAVRPIRDDIDERVRRLLADLNVPITR